MKKVKSNIMLLACGFLFISIFFGCYHFFAEKVFNDDSKIFFVSYNTQTFFDAVDDGIEFYDFISTKSKWSAEKYKKRLEKLKEVGYLSVERLGGGHNLPDVFVLQEVESKRVIEDFSKQLSKSEGYDYAVFVPPEKGAAFSSVIFSKHPISNVEFFYLSGDSIQDAKLRPLIKADIEINCGKEIKYLTVFAIHWKSKVGNFNSKLIREEQEKQLYSQISNLKKLSPHVNYIVCGDFNQTLEEFSLMKEYKNCWQFNQYQNELSSGLQKSGSYFYKNTWEQIDHIFYSDTLADGKDLELSLFSVIDSPPLLKESGSPYKFSVYSGGGYSDHLPIGCVLEFIN